MARDSKLPELVLFHFSERFFRSWNRRKERRVFGNPSSSVLCLKPETLTSQNHVFVTKTFF